MIPVLRFDWLSKLGNIVDGVVNIIEKIIQLEVRHVYPTDCFPSYTDPYRPPKIISSSSAHSHHVHFNG